MIEKAIKFMKLAHKGQFDKAGLPYWNHPYTVAYTFLESPTEDEFVAALLHDVLEDSFYTEQDLLDQGFSKESIEIVKLVSRTDRSITYLDWIKQLVASKNIGAMKVKLADNLHNSSSVRINALPRKDHIIKKKYEKSIAILLEGIIKYNYGRIRKQRKVW